MPNMQFTIKEEQNNKINFLEITIKKENNTITFDMYRKPTATDTTIPQLMPCHRTKLSAIRYLQNTTYLLNDYNKNKEEKIRDHILHNNKYDSSTLNKIK
jgi:hypothetical protein